MTSTGGQAEVTSSPSPICDLLGHANEAEVVIGGESCRALVDTGSMITSVGETYYKEHLQEKYPLQELNSLLKVEGAGGHQLKYTGYAEMEIMVPEHSTTSFWVPVLVAPDTTYNSMVPLIVGTNVIKMLFGDKSEDIWSLAINAVSAQEMVPEEAAVYCCRQMVIEPNKIIHFKGRVGSRGIDSGVLEPVDTLPGGVMLMQAAVSTDDGNKVQVVLRNLTDRTITIPPRQRVASLQSAKIMELGQDPASPAVDESKYEEEIHVHLEESNITPEDKVKVQAMLRKWKPVFASSSTELGTAKGVKHSIKLTDPVPFKDRPRRIPPAMYDEVKKHLQDMLACGAIRPSNSPYSSNVVLVRKKDGSLRVCLDFRKLNDKTIRDAYMIPVIEERLDCLQGATWYTCLDMQSGYWQIEMEDDDKAKTAFSVGSDLGFFECNRMPFGLTNAPATFQRMIEKTLKDLPNCFAYLDDIIIYSSGTVEEHLTKLETVFQRLMDWGLKLKPSKCHLLQKKIKYLGHCVSKEGVETDPDKVEAIRSWPQPSTIQQLRQTLGFFGYYRRFVQDFSKLAKPLHDLLKGVENKSRSNKNTPIQMNDEAVASFEKLKEKLMSPPILAFANYSLPFRLHTDASIQGLGAVLYQEQDGKTRVIAYASRGLKPSEVNYPAHKLEFLALKWAVCDKFHDYLYGHFFEAYTDSNPMSYVLTSAKLDATGHRWLAELSLYNFKIKYRSGKKNADADGLSRVPDTSPEDVRIIDRDAIEAMCESLSQQEISCIEQLCVSNSVVESLEEELFPMDMEVERTAPVWRELQSEDPVLHQLVPLVESESKPDVSTADRELRPYLREWDKLCMCDGVLYRTRIDPDSGSKLYQLVLPLSERETALTGLHDDIGHLGRERTLQLVRSRFYWPKMAEDVKMKVNTCSVCVKRKCRGHQRAPLVNITTSQPMELVCMDFLSLEPSKGGIENILVITDHFTRMAHAIPTRNQTAKTTAQSLYGFFMDYGFPLKLHSDLGRNFESQTIKELCKLCGIQKSHTTPYHPMGNGMTERFNQSLLGMLGCLTQEQKADWKRYVPTVVHAYNATRHESTGYSPFFLMFGRHPRLPVDIAMGLVPKDELDVDFTKCLKNRLDVAYKLATTQASKSSSRHKNLYDKKVRGSTVGVGDRVLVRNVRLRGKHKLANVWEDEVYVVLDQPNEDIPVFSVQREDRRGSKRTLHRNLLLPVNFLPLSPRTVAAAKKPASVKKCVKEPQPQFEDSRTESSTSEEDREDSDSESSPVRYKLRPRLNPAAREFVPRSPVREEVQEVVHEKILERHEEDDVQDVVFEDQDSVGSVAVDENDEVVIDAAPDSPTVESSPEPVTPVPRRSSRARTQTKFYGNVICNMLLDGTLKTSEERMLAMQIIKIELERN